MEAAIVGVDPGTTSAVAIVNLEGEVIAVEARRDWSREEMTRFIADRCRPVIIASDVAALPSTLEKMAASLNAETWTPQRDLLVREKRKMAERKNPHERDALAAAKEARKEYGDLIQKVLKTERPEEVFEKVVKSEAPNIAEALKERVVEESVERREVDIAQLLAERDALRERRDTLEKRLGALAEENDRLRERMKKKEMFIEKLKKRKPSPTKEIEKLKRRERRLKGALEERRKEREERREKEVKEGFGKGWLRGLVERHRERRE